MAEVTNKTMVRLYIFGSEIPMEVVASDRPNVQPEATCTWGELYTNNLEDLGETTLAEQKQELENYGRFIGGGNVGLMIRIDLAEPLPTTATVSVKPYKCQRCGCEEKHSSNHWGNFYARCNSCSWKNPMEPAATWECMEPLPATHLKPALWRAAKLGGRNVLLSGTRLDGRNAVNV